MINPVTTPLDAGADLRWRNWQARSAESDRRTATRMRSLMFVIVIVFAVWVSILLG
jgi:hypothetical protein